MDKMGVVDRLRRFEGVTGYMYRSTRRGVTVGVGHTIATVAQAQYLPWHGGPTSTVIAADYDRVRSAPEKLLPQSYAKLSSIRLAPESIEGILNVDIGSCLTQLRSAVPNLLMYPEPVQQALFDMAYDLGAARLALRHKKLLLACSAGDWQTAALESRRDGLTEERNSEVAAMFMEAVIPM